MGNQTVKCIIYTNDKEVGLKKLLDIEKEKNQLGIKTVFKQIYDLSFYKFNVHDEIKFSDGEHWIVVKPNHSSSGYRYHKALIDQTNTSIKQLNDNILPYGIGHEIEQEKYFN